MRKVRSSRSHRDRQRSIGEAQGLVRRVGVHRRISVKRPTAYTFRRLSRSPALVLTVVLSIGLGIAANATIFSLISRFILRPAPVGDPAMLLTVGMTRDGERCCNHFSWPSPTDVRDQAKTLSGVAAYYELVPASISGFGEPERVLGTSRYRKLLRCCSATHGARPWIRIRTRRIFRSSCSGITCGSAALPPIHRFWARLFGFRAAPSP